MSAMSYGLAPTGEIRYRPARLEDSEQIGLCLAAAFEPYRALYTPAAFADTVPSVGQLKQRVQVMSVWVAANSLDDIVGTLACSIEGDTGHLRGMAVHPVMRGSGIADRLLAIAENHVIDADCARLTLDTTLVLQRAIRFYRRNGFLPSGRSRDFFGMPLHEYAKHFHAKSAQVTGPR